MAGKLKRMIQGASFLFVLTPALQAESRSLEELGKIVATQQVLIVEMQMQLSKLKAKVCTAETTPTAPQKVANQDNPSVDRK